MGDTAGVRRLDLKEAALELGITSEAVRRRAKRGTLPSETGEDGRLYVWLPDVYDTESHTRLGDRHLSDTLLDRIEDENEFLRRELERLHRELERKDAILLTMAQRIPELEPAPEPRESPETQGPPVEGGEVPEEGRRPSWWRRIFGG